jgi:IS30 family transposase
MGDLVLYGLSLREISQRLQRHHSTISREIKRNRPTYADDAVYWYEAAQVEGLRDIHL